jgi:hypothetical protein
MDVLPLQLYKQDGFNKSSLHIKGWFIPYSDLKLRFWKEMARMYDSDENGKLNRVEFEAMLVKC